MKRRFVILGFVMAGAICAVGRAEFIRNGSFTAWYDGNWAFGGCAYQVTDVSYTQWGSCVLGWTSSWDYAQQTIPAADLPGPQGYTVEFWAANIDGPLDITQQIKVQVDYYDAAGNFLGVERRYFTLAANREWQRFGFSSMTPAHVDHTSLTFYRVSDPASGGHLHLDAVTGSLDTSDVFLKATAPCPVDGARNVGRSGGILRWQGARGASAYNVYFGTDPAAVRNATTGSPEFKGMVTAEEYAGVPALENGAVYYWRIDAVGSGGVIRTGDIWSFRAVTYPPGLTVDGGIFKRSGAPFHNIGVNYYNAFLAHLSDPADMSFAGKIASLRDFDIKFFRMCAHPGIGPYGSNTLYWQDRAEFFRRLDEVVAAAETSGIGIIPSLFWAFWDLPDELGEPREAWADPASRTRAVMRTYVREVVTRYVDSPAIWGWEIGNEYDLGLPEATCQVAFAAFAAEVRKYDPYRFISTGFVYPKADNPDPVESLGVHWYVGDPSNEAISDVMARAIATGKPIFMGEFGSGYWETGPTESTFYNTVIPTLVNQAVPVSAIWVYEFDEGHVWTTTPTNGLAYELTAIQAVNEDFDAGVLAQDGFEADLSKWSTDWGRTTSQKHAGGYSVRCGPSSNNLTSNVRMDARGYEQLTIEFWYRHTGLREGHRVVLQLFNGTGYVNKAVIDRSTADGTWLHCSLTIQNSGDNAEFFNPDFRIRFAGASLGYSSIFVPEYVWIDEVKVVARAAATEVLPVSVKGMMNIQGFTGDNTTVGLEFALQPAGGGQTLTRKVFLDAGGGFTLADVHPGEYAMTVRGLDALPATTAVTVEADPTVIVDPVELRTADNNGDGTVSFEDFCILQNSYGDRGGAGVVPAAAGALGGACSLPGLLLAAGLGVLGRMSGNGIIEASGSGQWARVAGRQR